MRRAAKLDDNHREIVRALEAHGCAMWTSGPIVALVLATSPTQMKQPAKQIKS